MENERVSNQRVEEIQSVQSATSVQLPFPLCKRCSRIDLTTVFTKRPSEKDYELHCKLGPFTAWNLGSCALCFIMSRTMNLKSTDDQPTKTELWSYTADHFANMIWIRNKAWAFFDLIALKIGHNLALQPDDEIYVFSQLEKTVPVRPIGPFIDFGIVHTWTTFCRHKHIKTCGDGVQTLRSQRATIPNFKVINCETRQIINAPEVEESYVALSYTWGQVSHGTDDSHHDLSKQLPLTIENTLEVTLKLGFKYLWIDRYCIDQENEKAKLEQIYKMDLIYNGAWVTIIAAAGDGPMHGLPGLEHSSRPFYPHVRIGTHLLASTLGNPMKEILNSTWFQRGWTYQEGLLSRRRLIFTDHQVYFECAGMYCCENQNVPLDQLHTADGQHFDDRYCNDRYIGMFPRQLATNEWDILDRISIYSTRRFSNTSDILNGFLGILRSFEMSSIGLRHCLGVPIFSLHNPDIPVTNPDIGTYPPVAGFCLGLNWYNHVPSERRAGFPSWSWTGWMTEPTWRVTEHWRAHSHPDSSLQIQFQRHDGRLVSWEDFHQHSYEEIGPHLSNVLQVAAWVLPIDLESLVYWSEYSLRSEDVSIQIETLGVLPKPSVLGVPLLHEWKTDWAPARTELMIIHEVEQGVYERFGSGSITHQRSDGGRSKHWKEFKLR